MGSAGLGCAYDVALGVAGAAALGATAVRRRDRRRRIASRIGGCSARPVRTGGVGFVGAPSASNGDERKENRERVGRKTAHGAKLALLPSAVARNLERVA